MADAKKYNRTKLHVNIGTIGHVDHDSSNRHRFIKTRIC